MHRAYSVAQPKRSAKGMMPNKLKKKTQPCNQFKRPNDEQV